MMKSFESVIESTKELIRQRGFLPVDSIVLGKREGSEITLLEAVHIAIGIHADDSFYAYWEWMELEEFLTALWASLDDAATNLASRTTSAIALATDKSCTKETVLSILESAQIDNKLRVPVLHRRPDKSFTLDSYGGKKSKSLIPGTGKLSWACLVSMGVLVSRLNTGYGDLFSSLTDEVRSNRELLVHLDERCNSIPIDLSDLETVDDSLILRTLHRAWAKRNQELEKDDERKLSISEFLIATDEDANWEGLTDQSVLRRLLQIAPETAAVQLRLIEKYLSD